MAEKLPKILNTLQFRAAFQLDKKIYPKKNLSLYIKTGNLLVAVNGASQELHSHSILFINKGSVFTVKGISQEFDLIMFEASSKLNTDLVVGFSRYDAYRTLQLLDGGLQLKGETFKTIWSHLKIIEEYWKRDIGEGFRERIIKNLYTALVYMVVEIIFKRKNKAAVLSDRKEAITIQFLELVERDFMINRKLGHYALQLNLTPKYVSNCVRETTGASPTDFIVKTTMDFSREYLIQKSATISELAQQLHFSDAYSFGKFFKKHSGYSPGKFRKLSR